MNKLTRRVIRLVSDRHSVREIAWLVLIMIVFCYLAATWNPTQ